MLAPRKSYLGQLGGWLIALVASRLIWPVADTTVQDYWKDKVEPYLTAHAFTWLTAVIDWLGPFWSGVGLTLLVMFVVEMCLAWRRKETRIAAQVPSVARETLIELGAECIRIADDAMRLLQQTDDAAPQLQKPPGGYANQEQFSRVAYDHMMANSAHQRRSLIQRDRAHGGELVDCLFRLRDVGLSIPNFKDSFGPVPPDDVLANIVPFYLGSYARFIKAMGLKLKRTELDAAIRASQSYRQTTEGPQAVPAVPLQPKPRIVDQVRLTRSHDVTSRWYARFKMALQADELTICLELQYFRQDSDSDRGDWGGKVRHPIERRKNLIFGQSLNIQFVEDAPYMIEQRSPHWLAPLAFEARGGMTPALTGFVRGCLTFIADGIEQEHKFIVLPRKHDQAMVIIGQESLTGEDFWSDDYKPLPRYLAFGERGTPSRKSG